LFGNLFDFLGNVENSLDSENMFFGRRMEGAFDMPNAVATTSTRPTTAPMVPTVAAMATSVVSVRRVFRCTRTRCHRLETARHAVQMGSVQAIERGKMRGRGEKGRSTGLAKSDVV
jgi:hypothetical protein